ncbi:MAG: TIGR03546 family protein [Candidatus Brocadiia bacterium]
MLLLKFLKQLFQILNGEVAPRQVAGGIAFGMILGLTPTFSLHNLVVVFLICIIRVNVSAVIFSWLLFGLASWAIDPLSHQLGYLLLVRMEFLKPLWTVFYNMPLIPLTGFNNTLLLGSLVISLILFYPGLIASEKGVLAYRASVKPRLEKLRIFQVLKASWIYQWYARISNFRN